MMPLQVVYVTESRTKKTHMASFGFGSGTLSGHLLVSVFFLFLFFSLGGGVVSGVSNLFMIKVLLAMSCRCDYLKMPPHLMLSLHLYNPICLWRFMFGNLALCDCLTLQQCSLCFLRHELASLLIYNYVMTDGYLRPLALFG